MLFEIEITPREPFVDREAGRVVGESEGLGCTTISEVDTARVFLVEGDLNTEQIESIERLLVDPVTETAHITRLDEHDSRAAAGDGRMEINVLFKPGMTDNVAYSTKRELLSRDLPVTDVATCRRYWFPSDASAQDIQRTVSKALANDAIERVVRGSLDLKSIALGQEKPFNLKIIPLAGLSDDDLMTISRNNLLSLSLVEMKTIQQHFADLQRDPTDIELETVAQTWSEHCSHKTLAGRIHYTDGEQDLQFENMLKETIFAATQELRKRFGADDWCVSVFKDNAGIVTFNDEFDACFKVETHNRPSALEPYGGANTGIGGVIRDCLGTGLGGRPVANTDVFCFAPPETKYEDLPPGVLHPKTVARGVISGVRDYGNRMGIPTVNGAVYFDERYIGNPLVYCGNVALIPVGKAEKCVKPGQYIVAIGGRTGLDGIHGATFSSAVLTDKSEETSGGAVQIGNAITEKMVADAILRARDRQLFSALTDCGAGGFSSAIGEMGEETGAEVWLDRAPLKYSGLSYMEIWISEAQERMVLAVPPEKWEEFEQVCASEGVEAVILGKFTDTKQLVLKYRDEVVGEMSMAFLHDGRPPIIRDATYRIREAEPISVPTGVDLNQDLLSILGSPNVCSKEWIIRQYDHEVQSSSVVKPLVGVRNDGPSDAAVIQPDFGSDRGLVISNGMNPRLGDHDPYWMAISAVDEAIRNCVAVGADPAKIAVLDNFCWGNTDRPETLGSLVRAALGCKDAALQYGTPFISGKDSLHNEFTYEKDGSTQVVSIPSSLLISALGQVEHVEHCVTMDLKSPGNRIAIVGQTRDELGGSHFAMIHGLNGGQVPTVHFETANRIFTAMHQAIRQQLIRSCHDLSEGGLAVAAAEMAFAGGLGMQLSLADVPHDFSDSDSADLRLLFSESNTRFLIEVPAGEVATVESVFANSPFAWIGEVTEATSLVIENGSGARVIEQDLATMKAAWQKPLAWG
ncbi:phosphoribosylformylglycinamidine synthase subunit PurL [Rubinisphaera margarita]|uniref:phosphoribosylformylglycinamidine synthase subunit PurL n=1 Tax=Rubinisphaera margarita TaxID=2909586 RepID=UPI001EE89C34|nr:phosphoribosylformylglycinamidine synthase subunit PurL [Rubinisphaera margarita]MCG6156658.1 phosphoribosylformylglycinamidine synthase subunit PurL [Rubinisphaera margarita]